MTEGAGNCPNPPTETFEEFQFLDMIIHIGWTEAEFADACMDYHPDTAHTYNWHRVLKNLWEATYSRIHSNLDLHHRFHYYNDWKHIINFTLALNKLRYIDATDNYEPMTLKALEEDLKKHNMSILPSHQLERDVVWALCDLICRLHNYLCTNPLRVYSQILELRATVERQRKDDEEKRDARRAKKAEQRQRKKKSRR